MKARDILRSALKIEPTKRARALVIVRTLIEWAENSKNPSVLSLLRELEKFLA